MWSGVLRWREFTTSYTSLSGSTTQPPSNPLGRHRKHQNKKVTINYHIELNLRTKMKTRDNVFGETLRVIVTYENEGTKIVNWKAYDFFFLPGWFVLILWTHPCYCQIKSHHSTSNWRVREDLSAWWWNGSHAMEILWQLQSPSILKAIGWEASVFAHR